MNNINLFYVIDDDKVHQFTIKKIIEYSQMTSKVMCFDNGEHAINFLTQLVIENQIDKYPEIILLDINMPVMDGWEFLEKYVLLKPKIGKKVLIYMVSSSNNQGDMDRAKAISDVSDYIVKPITKEHIGKMVTYFQNMQIN